MTHPQRSRGRIAVALVVAAVIMAACTSNSDTAGGVATSSAPTQNAGGGADIFTTGSDEKEIGSAGGELSTGGIVVTIPADAVATSTAAHLSTGTPVEPTGALVKPLGSPFTIDLSGLQPNQPLTITASIPQSAVPGDPSGVTLFTRHDGKVAAVPGTYDAASGQFSGTATQLSTFFFGWLNLPGAVSAIKGVFDAAAAAISISAPKPACSGQPAALADGSTATISEVTGPLWPCLTATDDKIHVTVASSDPLPWRVRSTQGSYDGAAATDTSSVMLLALYDVLATDRSYADGLIAPIGAGGWTIGRGALPADMQAAVSEGAWLAAVVIFALEFGLTVLSDGPSADLTATAAKAKAAMDAAAIPDCATSAIQAAGDLAPVDVTTWTSLLKAGFNCATTIAEQLGIQTAGMAGAVLGVLTSGAATAYAGFEGALRTVTNTAHEEWTVSLVPPTTPVAAAPAALDPNSPYRMRGVSAGQPMTADPDGGAFFSSPSGNIKCALRPGGGGDGLNAVCEVTDRAFPPDPRPAACPSPYPWAEQFMTITSTGASAGACVGDVLVPHESNVLPYGASLTNGDLTCSSAEDGMTCTDTATGNGFTVSKASFTPFTAGGPVTRDTPAAAADSYSFTDYVGTWGRHTSSLTIGADHSGTLLAGGGCCNSIKYTLQYDLNDDGSLAGTVIGQPEVVGYNSSRDSGYVFQFHFEQVASDTVLVSTNPFDANLPDINWCKDGKASSAEAGCGA